MKKIIVFAMCTMIVIFACSCATTMAPTTASTTASATEPTTATTEPTEAEELPYLDNSFTGYFLEPFGEISKYSLARVLGTSTKAPNFLVVRTSVLETILVPRDIVADVSHHNTLFVDRVQKVAELIQGGNCLSGNCNIGDIVPGVYIAEWREDGLYLGTSWVLTWDNLDSHLQDACRNVECVIIN